MNVANADAEDAVVGVEMLSKLSGGGLSEDIRAVLEDPTSERG